VGRESVSELIDTCIHKEKVVQSVRHDSPNQMNRPLADFADVVYSQERATMDEKDRTEDAMRIRVEMIDIPNFIFLTLVEEHNKKSEKVVPLLSSPF
jgi:hypothetical protein